jgi:hypothetical protein
MAAPAHRLRTPAGTGAESSNQECEWKQGESAVGEVRKGQTHFQEVKSVKVYRAFRWSAIDLIGDPGPKNST